MWRATQSSSTSEYPATIEELPPILQHPPSPSATPKAIRLNKKRAAVAADRIAKAKAKPKKMVTKQADLLARFVILAVIIVKKFKIILIQSVIRMLYGKSTNFFL